jgi:hypothetical protein
MLGFFIILYISVKKYNENMKSIDNVTILDDTEYESHSYICDDEFKHNFPEYKTENVKFDYNPSDAVIKQFQKEQKYGSNMVIKYPNKYINNESYGEWKSDTKVIYNEDLYKTNIVNVDGYMDKNTAGKTIQEIYDNNIVDFKKLIEKKNGIHDLNRGFSSEGASKLSYLLEDDWKYENEKPENGGQILDGFYASDPMVCNTPAVF